MTPEQQKSALYSAVTECDRMLRQADVDNTQERCERGAYGNDVARLKRYERRRNALVAHRRWLEMLYTSLYGENPWKDIAF